MTSAEVWELVRTLEPLEDDVIKREEGTLVWRGSHPDLGPIVVKLYRKRGRITSLRCRLTQFRVERESARLEHLMLHGIPCTEPLGWAQGHSVEHGWHEVLVMKEVPRAVQLDHYIRDSGLHISLVPLLAMVRRMHECGFCHQTLYTQNVLVSRGAPEGKEFCMVDVPRSWVFPGSIVGTSMARFDLLDLVTRLEAAGVTPEDIPLDAYGLDEDGVRWWGRHHGTNPTTKRSRLRRDAVARARWARAWLADRLF